MWIGLYSVLIGAIVLATLGEFYFTEVKKVTFSNQTKVNYAIEFFVDLKHRSCIYITLITIAYGINLILTTN